VIHAGIYYRPGSLKAELCREGRDRLYNFCRDRRVPYRQCGKWIVAVQRDQVSSLERLKANAAANDVALEWWSRSEGIARNRGFARGGGAELTADGDYRCPCLYAGPRGGYWGPPAAGLSVIHPLNASCRKADSIAWCWAARRPASFTHTAGSERGRTRGHPLAQHWEGMPASVIPRAHWSKGHYFAYSGRHPFSRLIYPLPDATGLGCT